VLSRGERSRVALAQVPSSSRRMCSSSTSPTNHLDKTTRRKLIEALTHYEGTIVCASHDAAIVDASPHTSSK